MGSWVGQRNMPFTAETSKPAPPGRTAVNATLSLKTITVADGDTHEGLRHATANDRS